MVKSQSKLTLRAMSESLAIRWQRSVSMSVLVLPLENMVMSLVKAAATDNLDVQGYA